MASGSSGEATERRLEEARQLGRAAKPQRDAAQRELLLAAMVETVAKKGYEACRVDDVLAASGLSRSTFYRHFDDKGECFAAAFEWAAASVFAEAERAVAESDGKTAQQVEAMLRAMLGQLAADPGAARLTLIEARVANAACREAQLRWLDRFAELLRRATGGMGEPGLARLTVGAFSGLMGAAVSESGPESLPSLLPQLVYVALAPYLGAQEAYARAW